MSEDIYQQLKQFIPEGSNLKVNKFLSGQQTSAFQSKNEEIINDGKELVSDLMTTTGAVVSAVNVVSLSADQMSKIAQAMAAYAIQEISSFTGKEIAEFTTKGTTLVTNIPNKISSKSIERFNSTNEKDGEIKQNIGDVLSKLASNKEDYIQKLTENIDANVKSDKISDVQKSIGETINKAKDFIQEANDEIYKVMEYAAEGPDYVARQMTNKINSIEENIKNVLNDKYKTVESTVNTFCEGEGKKIGARLVKEYNNIINKSAKQIFEKTENTKTKVLVKADEVIQTAKLKLFALIGV